METFFPTAYTFRRQATARPVRTLGTVCVRFPCLILRLAFLFALLLCFAYTVVPLNGVGKLLAMSYYFRLEQVCPIYIPVGNLRMGSSAGGGILNNSRSGPRSLEKRKRRLASVKCVALTRYEMRSGSEILVVCTVGVHTKEIALCEG